MKTIPRHVYAVFLINSAANQLKVTFLYLKLYDGIAANNGPHLEKLNDETKKLNAIDLNKGNITV